MLTELLDSLCLCVVQDFFSHWGQKVRRQVLGFLFVWVLVLVFFFPPGFGIYSFKDWSFLLVASRTNQLNYTQS